MRNHRSGLSLLESLIASVILIVISSAIYLVLFNASATYTNETRAGDIQDRARRVADEISRELRAGDTTQRLSLNKNTRSNTLSFRVPKRVDAATGNIIWSDNDDTANPGFYNAGSPYPATPVVVCYRYETSAVNADNNTSTTEGRIVRTLQVPGGGDIANTRRIISDYVRPPAVGGEIFQRGNDDTVLINITFLTVDDRNRVMERNIQTSVSVRNKS